MDAVRRRDTVKPRSPLLAVVATAFLVLLATVPAAFASDWIKGVDVSMWQGDISWGKVPDRIEFAFVKATEGDDFADPRYLRNRRAVREQGIKLGAYHFARPSGSGDRSVRKDARSEASHFVNSARVRGRDLLPVLDLEASGGLSTDELIRWAKRWLLEVEEDLGVPGMLYTYPDFWKTSMGNTKWFAKNGYRTLWIANWETDTPDVPADNWNHNGWTFWQYTDCGSVRGIEGCVDMDNYRYPGLGRVTIRSNR